MPQITNNTTICTFYLRFVKVTFKEIKSAHKWDGYQAWMVGAIVLHYGCGRSTMGGPSSWQLQTGKHTKKNTYIEGKVLQARRRRPLVSIVMSLQIS